ncbi:MAG: Ni/Fe hydrogenase subunit alpha [Candidatus Hodarchaeales archaeon]|jgi:F420-non-reducing hydrogenase large subunit
MKSHKVIKVDPVSRIEGHAEIKLLLDESQKLVDAQVKIVEVRGFEKFLVGRPIEEMPLLTPRMCGICHTPHHLCSAKAVDSAFGLEPEDIPSTAYKLRQLMLFGSYIHSHVLHFFYLAAPDFVLGPNSDPAKRNVIGLLEANPELVKRVIAARKVGQTITKILGGRSVHPVTGVPGGQSHGLSNEDRDKIERDVKGIATDFLPDAKDLALSLFDQYFDVISNLAVIPTMYMGMVGNEGELEFYNGRIRLLGKNEEIVDEFRGIEYRNIISERIKDYSYLKFPYYKKATSFDDGIYRVGPLARLNVIDRINTPIAQELFSEFRNKFGRPANQTMLYHYARIIELAHSVESVLNLVQDPEITGSKLRTSVKPREGDGVGIVEAHRGTLFHHYVTDRKGIVTDVNLIVATVGNNEAINRSVKDAATNLIVDGIPKEGLTNQLEMVIRAYDPCFSCATHYLKTGAIATEVKIIDFKGSVTHTTKNWESQARR